ncbi:Hypothetical protein A7982_04696 [Minicystis rosea]|nr:Hypothetical protein A7982_04696 [Minicystis rosea]
MIMRPVRTILTAAAVLPLFACGSSGTGAGASRETQADCAPNEAMMKALAPTCEGCHLQGNAPFFASLGAFQDTLVYNEKYVVPGKPDESYLVKLLEGEGQGTFKQMPISGESFAKLAEGGNTKVSMAEVRQWIKNLSAQVKNDKPDPKAITVARQSALQIRATLYAQLGLSHDDFFFAAQTHGTPALASKGEGRYPIYGADEAPSAYETPQKFRYASLGGSSALEQRQADTTITASFAQALTPISQAWCRLGIAKAENKTLLFPEVDPKAKSTDAADAIKKNIGYLHLHFLGEPAAAADIDNVFQNVFVPLEAENDPTTAWTGVCAYFVRHPRWVLY